MNRIFFLLTFLFFTYSCSSPEPRYIQLVDKIMDAYSSELKLKHDMYLTGKGGMMMHNIKVICATYISFAACSVDEARRLYVEIAEEYLNRINEHEEMRQYLNNYPFTISNLELNIGFDDITYHRRGDGYVGCMYVVHSNLYYKAYKEDGKLYTLYKEPYSEAVRIVAAEQAQK
jgi:hypothetical protein